MSSLRPVRLGSALAATVAIGYAACTAIFRLLPESSAAFMQSLFHGIDFRPLVDSAGFTLASFVFALVVLAVWAFLMGALLAWLMGRFATLDESPRRTPLTPPRRFS